MWNNKGECRSAASHRYMEWPWHLFELCAVVLNHQGAEEVIVHVCRYFACVLEVNLTLS